jgi:Skp family chaperone for outer membrane proteins
MFFLFLLIFPILRIMPKIHSIKTALDPILEKHNTLRTMRDGGVPPLSKSKEAHPITRRRKKVKTTRSIIGVVIALGLFTVPAIAQQTAQQAPALPTVVAVVDVAQLIKQHPDFQARQKVLQEQVKQAEATFQVRQQGIANKQKGLESSNYKAGSPEHQRLLDEIAGDVADFDKDAKAQQRRFALENSKIMYDTYQDIKATIARFAAAHNIAQVTDYREFEPNPADPQTVAEDMDQKLVWFNASLNITNHIIRLVYTSRNLPLPTPTGAAASPAGTAVNPARTATPGAPVNR